MSLLHILESKYLIFLIFPFHSGPVGWNFDFTVDLDRFVVDFFKIRLLGIAILLFI